MKMMNNDANKIKENGIDQLDICDLGSVIALQYEDDI